VLERLTDQQTMIHHFMGGYGTPVYGPTPVYPKNNIFLSSGEKKNPYPFSISTAVAVLKAHGWKINPGKADVCVKPGPTGCGTGVKAGQKLSLNLLYSSGQTILQEDTDLLQSDASQAGVQINARAEQFNTVVSQVQPCILPKDKGTPTCNWQLGEYGGLGLATFPSGTGVFNTGGAFNSGQYSNPTLDKLINESTVSTSLDAYHAYENLVVKEEPWIWQPLPENLIAVANNLHGYGITSEFTSGFGQIYPQFWHFT
jgi:peptide/nickel transport system substrate-binding protein